VTRPDTSSYTQSCPADWSNTLSNLNSCSDGSPGLATRTVEPVPAEMNEVESSPGGKPSPGSKGRIRA